TAAPISAVSEIGVSMIRSGPNSSSNPSVEPKIPPYAPMSSPSTNTSSLFFISERIASAIALLPVNKRFFTSCIVICSLQILFIRIHLLKQPSRQGNRCPLRTGTLRPLLRPLSFRCRQFRFHQSHDRLLTHPGTY